MKKFDLKKFERKRTEKVINGNPGISKIWVWNEAISSYEPPTRGKAYRANRTRTDGSIKSHESEMFDSLEAARKWRTSINNSPIIIASQKSIKFEQVISNYRSNYISLHRASTQDSYNKIIKKYLVYFNGQEMNHITPSVIDAWITWLKTNSCSKRRMNYKHEMSLLSGILRFYQDLDDKFILPIKPRHSRSIVVRKPNKANQRDKKFISDKDFFKFRECLKNDKNGDFYYNLATVQYFSALRISEVTALAWDNFIIDTRNPQDSFLQVRNSIYFKRGKNLRPELQDGFKNSNSNDGYKNIPLFQESYKCLMQLKQNSQKIGLIFLDKKGELPSYRQIQHAYDQAFKKANLKYSGTHIMRHGGASYVYNKSNGDLAVVGQITGNKDLKSIQVYAHRDPAALKKLTSSTWEQ